MVSCLNWALLKPANVCVESDLATSLGNIGPKMTLYVLSVINLETYHYMHNINLLWYQNYYLGRGLGWGGVG